MKRREHVKVVAIDFSRRRNEFPLSISLLLQICFVMDDTFYYKYVLIVLVIKRNWSLSSATVERKIIIIFSLNDYFIENLDFLESFRW